MKFLSALVLFLATLSSAQAQSMGRGPLGLEWGQSLEDTKKLGVEATTQANDEFGKAVIFTKLPQTIADAEIVFGSYGYDDKLFRVVIVSKPVDQ